MSLAINNFRPDRLLLDRPLLDQPSRETGMTRAEWAAVWGLRQLAGGFRCSSWEAPLQGGLTRDLMQAGAAFAGFCNQPETAGRIELGGAGWLSLTRDERRLLKALAAAQAGQDWRLDLTLFKLAPHPAARRLLAEAISMLGAALALLGHWLPAPSATEPAALPPAAMAGQSQGAIGHACR